MSVESIIAQMQAEAHRIGHSRGLARSTGTVISASKIPLWNSPRHYSKALARDDVEHLITDRDPCVGCGTRKDWHDEFGCKRWRAGRWRSSTTEHL